MGCLLAFLGWGPRLQWAMRAPAFLPTATLVFCAVLSAGCEKKPKINYLPLTQAGFATTTVSDLKKLDVTDAEIPQIVQLKTLGLSDETSLALVKEARAHHHSFSSGDSAGNLIGAGYTEQEIGRAHV